jgi:hypothetical protein
VSIVDDPHFREVQERLTAILWRDAMEEQTSAA